jgi:hypothetical protein
VKITAQDLQRQYREMADDELLALNPADLMDLARTCLQAELVHRGLSHDGPAPVAPAAPTRPLPPGEDASELTTYVSETAAQNALSALTAAGIPATLDGNSILVPDSLHREAHDILHELEALASELVEQWLRDSLPGRRILIEDMLSQDDIVAARLTLDGKQQAFCFVRIFDRKIAETWHNFADLKG